MESPMRDLIKETEELKIQAMNEWSDGIIEMSEYMEKIRKIKTNYESQIVSILASNRIN